MPPSISSDDLGIAGAASVLVTLEDACRSVGVSFFLVGALARDILLHHLRGVDRSPRLTRDVDVAVAVESWEHFDRLQQTLIAQHDFQTTRTAHRLQAPGPLLVDVVPFGAVEDERHQVRWPPDFVFEMSVLGYREAFERTETVMIDDVEVRVIPLRAFGPLKLLAWADRRHKTPRDAEDFCFVVMSYWEAETEQILDAHADLFEAEEGDIDFIGARAYGREAGGFVSRSHVLQDALLDLMERETADIHDSRLAIAMGQTCSYAYERRFAILLRFRQGLEEALGS